MIKVRGFSIKEKVYSGFLDWLKRSGLNDVKNKIKEVLK